MTSTLSGGTKTVVASTYTQRYATMYESAEVPLSGEIGLGTQTGVSGVGASEGVDVRAGVGLGVGVVMVVVGGMGLVL